MIFIHLEKSKMEAGKSSGRSTWIKAEPIEEKELEELEVLSSKERNNKKESE